MLMRDQRTVKPSYFNMDKMDIEALKKHQRCVQAYKAKPIM